MPVGVRGRGGAEAAAVRAHIPQGLPGHLAPAAPRHLPALPEQGPARQRGGGVPPPAEPAARVRWQ